MRLIYSYMNYLRTNKKNTGFTLLETLVAISILIIAITGTFGVAQNSLSSSYEARDQVVAFYLAQEAVEMVRNLRDENSLARINDPTISWIAGLAAQPSDPCYFGKTCAVDAVIKTFSTCPSGRNSCYPIFQDTNPQSPTYRKYGQNASWTQTNFNREINLSQATTTELAVEVTMRWTKGLLTRTFIVNEIIRDWQ